MLRGCLCLGDAMGRVLQVLALDAEKMQGGALWGVEARVQPSPAREEAVVVWLRDRAFVYGRIAGV